MNIYYCDDFTDSISTPFDKFRVSLNSYKIILLVIKELISKIRSQHRLISLGSV